MGKKKKRKNTGRYSSPTKTASTTISKPYSNSTTNFLNRYGLLILTVFIILYVVVFGYTSYMKYQTFSYYDFDLAIFNQVTWNTLHGDFMYSSIRENVYNFDGTVKPVGIFFKEHVPVILLFFLPVYAIFQSPLTLLMIWHSLVMETVLMCT